MRSYKNGVMEVVEGLTQMIYEDLGYFFVGLSALGRVGGRWYGTG